MRSSSHTLVAAVRGAVQAWRKREGWSRETVTQEIVDTFERMEGEQLTGLRFDPDTRDTYERQKVNADRLFRWLDDESKDNNLLPVNVLPFILAALPLDLRIKSAQDCMEPAGLLIHVASAEIKQDVVVLVRDVAREGGEAVAALAAIIQSASRPALTSAHRELTEAIAANQCALATIEARLADCVAA